jgi:ABC-type transport system substrate-binding protein
MKKILWSSLSVAVALVMAFAGFTGMSIAQEPKVLTVVLPSEPSHLDPKDSMGFTPDIIYHIYRKLYKFTPEMVPVPDLAVSQKISDDKKVWTLGLEKGVTFFDGTPVNAQAVKYSIDRMKDPKLAAPMAELYEHIKEVRVIDDYTVRIETDIPFSPLQFNLAHPNTGVISPKADKELGSTFGRSPVSCGPYKVEKWATGDRLTLTRFEGYKGPRPYFDKIIFRVVPAAETRLAMVESGEANVALRMNAMMAQTAGGNSALQVIPLKGTRLIYFYYQLNMKPMDDLRVRKALSMAVDRELIRTKISRGAADPARSVIKSGIAFSCDVGDLKYDPVQARALLQEAGVLGQKIKIMGAEGAYENDRAIAEAVAGFIRAVGMVPELEIISDSGARLQTMTRREHHLGMVGWGGSTGDPDAYLRRQLWGKTAGKPWGYNNPKVDALIDQAAQSFDNAERTRLYCEIQNMIWNDYPWLIVHRVTGFTVARANLVGVEAYVNSQALVFTNAKIK